MPQAKEELVRAAKEKWERDQLIAAAKEKWASENSEPKESFSTGQKVAQSVRSAAEGLTFGLSEPVVSALMAGQQHLKKSVQDADGVGSFVENLTDAERLKAEFDADVALRRKFEAENPVTALTAELTGAAVPAFFTGGATAAAKGVTALPRAVTAVGDVVSQGARMIPKVAPVLEGSGVVSSAARIGEGALRSAAQAVAGEGLKQAAQVPTGFIKPEEAMDLGDVAAMGGAFGGAIDAIPEAAKAAGKVGKFAARAFGGVGGNDVDIYMARHKEINAIKDPLAKMTAIKDEIDGTIGSMREAVETAKLSKEQARDAVGDAKTALRDLINDTKSLSREQRGELSQKLRDATADLNFAFKEAASDAKNARLPLQADDVLDSVEKVKTQVTELSQESYKILDDFKGKFSLKGVTKGIDQLKKGLTVEGVVMSDDAAAAVGVLDKWKEKLGAIDKKEIPAPVMKKIIQEIDSDMRKYSDKLAGEYNDKSFNTLMSIRRVIDQKIKSTVPGYEQVMEATSELNQRRAEFVKLFGKRENVVGKLNQMANPKNEFERKALEELGTLAGKDYKTPLAEYMAAKAKMATPGAQEALKQSLPQYGDQVDAAAKLARFNSQQPEILAKAAKSSPQAQALRSAGAGLKDANLAVKEATAALEPFKKITPDTSENYIRTLMGDRTRKIQLKRLMTSLGDISDENFVQMIDDLRMRENFDKGRPQGSANTNLWAIVSGVTGMMMGDPTLGLASLGAGATFGRIMDSYGPKITKRILDGVIFMKGVPTFQKIDSVFADLPPELKNELKQDLMRMVTVAGTSGRIAVQPDQVAELAGDISGAEHLSNTEKAEAITGMSKDGSVDSAMMQKLMIGQGAPAAVNTAPALQPRRAPDIRDVTDFIKTRKPEAY